jgi:hypothetical protein
MSGMITDDVTQLNAGIYESLVVYVIATPGRTAKARQRFMKPRP